MSNLNNKVMLGFKDNPTFGLPPTGDDCIDIGGISTYTDLLSNVISIGSGTNYELLSLDLGEISYSVAVASNNGYDGNIPTNIVAQNRIIKAVVGVRGNPALVANNTPANQALCNQDMMFRVSEINRYLQASNNFFSTFKGSPPNSLTGQFGNGKRCFLTIQPDDYNFPTYFDVLYGKATIKSELFDPSYWKQNYIAKVEITMTCLPFGRGERVKLYNTCKNGYFSPYHVSGGKGQWLIGTNFNFPDSLSGQNGAGFYYPNGLVYVGTSGTVSVNRAKSDQRVFTNSGNVPSSGTETWLAACEIYVAASPTTASLTKIKLYSRTAAAGDTYIKDLLSINNVTFPAGYTSWGTNSVSNPLGAGFVPIRISTTFSMPAGSIPTFWIECPNEDGIRITFRKMALLRNPVSSANPIEYISFGGSMDTPEVEIRNIQGDVETPCQIKFISSGASIGDIFGGFVHSDTYTDDISPINVGTKHDNAPLMPVEKPTTISSGTGAATYTDASCVDGSALYLTGNTGTFRMPINSQTYGLVDRYTRNYKVFARYALESSKANLLTSLTFTANNGVTVNLRTDIPSTYTGGGAVAPTTVSNWKIGFWGEINFSEAGAIWADYGIKSIQQPQIDFVFGSGTGNFGIDCLFFVPIDDGWIAGNIGAGSMNDVIFSNEGLFPDGGIIVDATNGEYYRFDNTVTKGKLLSFNLMLRPKGHTKGVVLFGNSLRVNTELFDNTANGYTCLLMGLEYTPRYIHLRPN